MSVLSQIEKVKVELRSKPPPDPNATRKPLHEMHVNLHPGGAVRPQPHVKGLVPPAAARPAAPPPLRYWVLGLRI